MIKRLLFIAYILFFTFGAYAQYPKSFFIEKVDSAAGAKSELFVKANEWVAKTFKDAQSVIQMSDKEAGKIIAKGIMVSTVPYMLRQYVYYTSFTLSISIKDGRYKYALSDFILTGSQHGDTFNSYLGGERPKGFGGGVPAKIWEEIKADCWKQAKEYGSDLELAMKRNPDNW